MEASFESVYDRYGEAIHAYLSRLTCDPWEADELCQETFLRYLSGSGLSAESNGALRPWLFRVATNLGIDRLRRRRARPLEGEPAAPPSPDEAPADLADRIRDELGRLSAELRGTFLLRAHHGLPYREVASAFGVSERAAKDRFRRAREQLVRRLTPLLEEEIS